MPQHEIVVRGESFACRDTGLSAWTLLKLAKASTSGDEMTAIAAMYDVIMGALEPEEHQRFDAFMTEQAVPMDEVNEALGTLIQGYTALPTDRLSPLPDGPMPTGAGSRVVSLSKPGSTPRKSSTGGAPAAS